MEKRDSILASCTRYFGALFVAVCGFLTARFTVDYRAHTQAATELNLKEPLEMFKEHVEPLWHVSLRVIQKVAHCSPKTAGCAVSALALAVSFLIAWHAIKRSAKGITSLQTTALCLVLHLSAAIYIPWFNKHPYLGQGTPNVWHNPTLIMVRPISLLAFIVTARQLQKIKDSDYEKNLSVLAGLFVAFLLVLANLAKPSYAQVFYPGIFFLMLGWLVASKGRAWKHCVQFFFMCLPSVILMIFQFIFTFMKGAAEGEGAGGAGGIIIAPFQAAGKYTPSIPISLLLVLAFPLFMTLVTLIRRRFGQREILAWILVLVGLTEKLLLAETGYRIYDGNFGWGYLNALLILWFVSIRDYADAFFSVREEAKKPAISGNAGGSAVQSAGSGVAESVSSAAGSVGSAIGGITGNISGAFSGGLSALTAGAIHAVTGSDEEAGPAEAAGEQTTGDPSDMTVGSISDGPAGEAAAEGGASLPELPSADPAAETPAAELTFSAPEEESVSLTVDMPDSVMTPEMLGTGMTEILRAEGQAAAADAEETDGAEEASGKEEASGTEDAEELPEVHLPSFLADPAPELPEAEELTAPADEAAPEEPAEDTAAAKEAVSGEGAQEEETEKGGFLAFMVKLVRGTGFVLSSIILAAHFFSGLYYLFFWLIWLRNTI